MRAVGMAEASVGQSVVLFWLPYSHSLRFIESGPKYFNTRAISAREFQ